MNKGAQLDADCEVIHQETVDKVRTMMPQEDDFYHLANLYKMFSDNTRIQILWALSASEMCVCDIAVLLNMTKSTISHQLKSLRLAKLIRYRKEGKVVFYALADHHVKDIFLMGLEHIHE